MFLTLIKPNMSKSRQSLRSGDLKETNVSPDPERITSTVCCLCFRNASSEKPTRVSDHNQGDTCWDYPEAPAHMGRITGPSNWLVPLRGLKNPLRCDWLSCSVSARWVS